MSRPQENFMIGDHESMKKAKMGQRFLVSDAQLTTLFTYIEKNDTKRAAILINSIREKQLVFESNDLIIARDIERVRESETYIKQQEIE
jgi:hypothetical protein